MAAAGIEPVTSEREGNAGNFEGARDLWLLGYASFALATRSMSIVPRQCLTREPAHRIDGGRKAAQLRETDRRSEPSNCSKPAWLETPKPQLRKFFRSAMPSVVMTLSGWNWTPWTGSSL